MLNTPDTLDNTDEMVELKSEAKSLGINFNANIGKAKLQEKVDAHYKSKESSGPSIASLVAANKVTASTVVGSSGPVEIISPEKLKRLKILSRKKAAQKTRVVKIVDNDPRQNNLTTTATANCSNEHFDLGTRILPLNENIEVSIGHINVLKEVMITLHTVDPKTQLSVAKSRNRYSISYEENQV